jgi:peptide/nickel transport system permease protein
MRRTLLAVPTLFAVSCVIFILIKCVPGDAARLALGEKASEEVLADYRQQLGLDRPLLIQYGLFLQRFILHADLGNSIRSGEAVTEIIAAKFPATFELALCAMLLAIFGGVLAGTIAAIRPKGFLDMIIMGASVTGVSMPVFWLGLLLMWFLGLEMGWLPLSGRFAATLEYQSQTGFLLLDAAIAGNVPLLLDGLHHLILPALTLASIPLAFLARMTRSALLDVMKKDYIRTARAKGADGKLLFFRHGLRNAAIPIINISGLQFGGLLAGAMITETVFSWPGMGRWILESVHSRDIPAMQGGVLTIALTFIVINTLTDILFTLADARVKVS